jgi:hypothetical protein
VATALEVKGSKNTKPMHVIAPMLIVKTIAQTTMYPCQLSYINVKLMLNVPLYVRGNLAVTVQLPPEMEVNLFPEAWGLPESSLFKFTDCSSKFFERGTVSWNKTTREVSTKLLADVVAANTPLRVYNPTNASMGVMPMVRVLGLTMFEMMESPMGDTKGLPGTVKAARFTTSVVSQSNPYPAVTNTLSLQIKTNVPFPGPMSGCPIAITITGLDGACQETGMVAIVSQKGSSDSKAFSAFIRLEPTDLVMSDGAANDKEQWGRRKGGKEGQKNALEEEQPGGLWDKKNYSITFHMGDYGMLADTLYDVSFQVCGASTSALTFVAFVTEPKKINSLPVPGSRALALKCLS